ncbi:hypothetical protein G6F57_018476 [Rhizopus arrhizus]|nr:hypothetical protein G6F22_019281 [Rhizopus arrhizus]KAG1442187.1 hypothetical protein G6F57_018476 [Rhizopus arrhizus]
MRWITSANNLIRYRALPRPIHVHTHSTAARAGCGAGPVRCRGLRLVGLAFAGAENRTRARGGPGDLHPEPGQHPAGTDAQPVADEPGAAHGRPAGDPGVIRTHQQRSALRAVPLSGRRAANARAGLWPFGLPVPGHATGAGRAGR